MDFLWKVSLHYIENMATENGWSLNWTKLKINSLSLG